MTTPSPTPDIDWELLDRVLSGHGTVDDSRVYEAMLQANPTLQMMLDVVRAEGNTADKEMTSAHAIDSFERLSEKLDGAEGVFKDGASERSPLEQRKGVGAYLWGMIGLAMIVTVLLWTGRGSSDRWSPGRRYTTASAQRAVVILPDGSIATLAPHTTLVLASNFGSGTRTVMLSGKAYFEVPHGAVSHTPFIVRSGTVTTRVLGTAFDIQCYPHDRNVRVVVIRGKVSTGATRTATVSAGVMATVTDSTVVLNPIPNVAEYSGWVNGRLIFDRAQVSDMLAALGQWYGVRFTLVDSSLGRQHVTAAFDGTSRTGMLAAVASLLNVTPAMTSHDTTTIVLQRRNTGITAPTRNRANDSLTTSHTEYGR